jgi:hypothetical protein
MKVVTDPELAGPNKVCGPTSFRKVPELMSNKSDELIYKAFPEGLQQTIVKISEQWPTISSLLDLITDGVADKLINDKLRTQIRTYMPSDMSDAEKEEFLRSIPSTMLDTYQKSLDRIIRKMEEDP